MASDTAMTFATGSAASGGCAARAGHARAISDAISGAVEDATGSGARPAAGLGNIAAAASNISGGGGIGGAGAARTVAVADNRSCAGTSRDRFRATFGAALATASPGPMAVSTAPDALADDGDGEEADGADEAATRGAANVVVTAAGGARGLCTAMLFAC